MEPKKTDPENVKVIEWEDFEQEVARLWSLSSAITEAKQKKQGLQEKLESLIQVRSEPLSCSNELEEMRQKLENRKLVMESMLTRSKVAKEDAKMQEQQLSSEVRSILIAGTALSIVRKRLQEASRILAGERGYCRLKNLERMVRLRQQYMVLQVSLLYPMKTLAGPTQEQELEAFPSSSTSGSCTGSKPLYQRSLTISGLQLTMLPSKKMSFFTDKKEVQRSATALGYAAHAVSLIASYLEVPLRYPVHLGGSHSHINDYAPSIEPTSNDLLSTALLSPDMEPVQFPLFLEGQDRTRATYAMFLLNKNVEQLLNFIGVMSLGPRHILANLKELLRIILSADYIDT